MQTSKLKDDKKKSRDESCFHYSKNIIWGKWYENKSVLILVTNIDSMSGVSKVMRHTKDSVTKAPVSYFNITKLYNNSMCDVYIMDQKAFAYTLPWPFHLKMCFGLIYFAI